MNIPPVVTPPCEQQALERFLLQALRVQLALPEKYTDSIIRLNLPFLFAQEEHAAINWINFIEASFRIDIPDSEADIFFLSSPENMAATIIRHSPIR